MSNGPVDLVVVKFPGNVFNGGIGPALRELTDQGTIRIIDILLMRKDNAGNVTTTEISELEGDEFAAFDPLSDDVPGLLSTEDAVQLAGALERNESAALMLFENTWATRFVDALRRANSELVLYEHIPRVVMEQLYAAEPETP